MIKRLLTHTAAIREVVLLKILIFPRASRPRGARLCACARECVCESILDVARGRSCCLLTCVFIFMAARPVNCFTQLFAWDLLRIRESPTHDQCKPSVVFSVDVMLSDVVHLWKGRLFQHNLSFLPTPKTFFSCSSNEAPSIY